MRKQHRRIGAATIIALSAFASVSTEALGATSFGVNFQGGQVDQWGPYYLNQVGAWGAGPYASAFGLDAANWYEPGPGSVKPATAFSSPSMNGASVNISFSAYPDFSFSAYGYANANQLVNNGIPESGDHAVLAGFLFGEAASPVVLNISGLSNVATANGIPLQYSVTLLASSPNRADAFLPALVEDSDLNSDSVPFEIFAEHPDYWYPDPASFTSSGGMGNADGVFTGNNLTISVIGPNESGGAPGSGTYTRSSLAGVIVTFVPEPSTGVMLMFAVMVGMVRSTRRPR